MDLNQIYLYLYHIGFIPEICTDVINYTYNSPYNAVMNEFKVLMYYYNHYYSYTSKNLFKVIPRILEAHRRSKMYKKLY